MPHPRFLAAFGLLFATACAFGVGPWPDMDERRAYAALFERMGDRDWAERGKAERDLVAKGFAALPHLKRAMAHPDIEVRRRVLRYLPGLEHALLVMPKRYTVSIKDQTFSGVLEAIQKATGNKVVGNVFARMAAPGKGPEKFNYEFKDATFWEMVDLVCRDGGYQIQGNWGDDTIRLQPSVGASRHTGTDGSFRYAATNFQMYRNVDLAAPKTDPAAGRTDSLTLNFTLHAEPRLPFLGNDTPRVESAYDDTRTSMVPSATVEDGGAMNPWGGRFVSRRGASGGYKQLLLNVAVPLARGGDKARTLKSLKGSVPVTLLVEQVKLVVADDILKAKDRKKELEGVEFHIHETKKLPTGQYQLRMTVTNRAVAGDYNWLNTLYQRIEFQDAKGGKYQNYGSSWGGGGPSVQMTLSFGQAGAGLGEPAKLVYTHWVTKLHDVQFEFKDVPLP